MATIDSRTISVNEFCKSPIQRSNAINVLRSLRLWRQFRLNPANTALLAEQSELTTKQVEAALDFLLIAKVLRLTRRNGGGVFVERVKQESEAA
jgi:hypothetical protein